MSRHWTDEEILDRLYGLEDDNGHLAECPECRARWDAAVMRRQLPDAGEAAPELLARQREQIYRRIETPQSWFSLRLVSALAGAGALAVGLLVYSPAPQPRKNIATQISDAQLHSDIYSMMASAEPQAAEPVKGLFEQ